MTRTRQTNLLALSVAAAISVVCGCGKEDGGGVVPPATPGGSAGSGGSRPAPSTGQGGVGGAGGETTYPGAGGSPSSSSDAGGSTPTADALPAVPPPPEDFSWLSKPVPVLWITLNAGATIPAPGAPKAMHALGNLKVIQDHDGSSVTSIEGKTLAVDAAIQMEGRGQSSFTAGAKFAGPQGYNIEFHDGQRNGVGRALLGMAQNADWALVTCVSDKTCLRNALTYATGQEMVNPVGRWAPRFRWAEVYINGAYNGVYLVAEKPKDDKFRVNLPNVPDNAPPNEHGYLISADSDNRAFNNFDRFNPVEEFLDERARMTGTSSAFGVVPGNRRWKIRSPNPGSKLTAAQRMFLQTSFDDMTRTLDAAMGDWRAAIDVPSFIDYYVISELTNNIDAFFKSWYLYRMPSSAGGKWFMGPIWDFDLAYGNANYYLRHCATNTQIGPLARVLTTPSKDEAPPAWAIAPLKDPAVRNELRCRWNTLRTTGPLALAKMEARIDAFVTHLRTAKTRDTQRWTNYPKYVWPNNHVAATWDDDVRYLKFWLRTRLAWVDRSLPGMCASTPNPPATAVPQLQPPNSAPASRVVEMWAGEALDRPADYVDILGTMPAQWACPPRM